MSTSTPAIDRRGNGRDWITVARTAAGRSQETGEQEMPRELLAFELAGSPYAIPVERVREIVKMREVTPMPRVPSSVLGVVALRGEIVQVVDLRMRLDLETAETTRRSRVIVLHGDDNKVTGVLVDAVQEVLRVPEDQISASSSAEIGAVSELCARGEEFVSIIDMDRALEFDAD